MILIKKDFKHKTYKDSVLTAYIGLKKAFKSEKNFKVHILIGAFMLIIDILIGISFGQLLLVLTLASTVLVAEIFNTCIEYICDAITQEYDSNIKNIKDIAAGGVLITGISFFLMQILIIGGVIFGK